MSSDTNGDILLQSSGVACGEGSSFCAEALNSGYETVLRSDPCAVKTATEFNTYVEDYIMWMPKYKRNTCEGNGYLNCSSESERFGPTQVTQESFLQGRGQVTANTGCAAGGVKYLPAAVFTESFSSRAKPRDMSLFSQPTVVPRSCGTLTEVDMQKRFLPLPGAWQGSYSPLANRNLSETLDPRSDANTGRARQTMTLGNRDKYPDWGELKTRSEPYS